VSKTAKDHSASRGADTIVAIATPPGRGAVGIVRLSGKHAASIAARLAGELPAPRHASLRYFRDEKGDILDRGLAVFFPAPASFTGEDVVELHGHGGPAVLQALLGAACALGARLARAGEFSERAFLNGRMDLAQAEAIADLIDAASREAAMAASRSLDGALSNFVRALLEELTQLRIFVEGALDFSDEDTNWLSDDSLRTRLEALREHLRELVAQAAQGRRLREGLTVAIAGQPNVGKSTLLNRLAGTEAAIVTDIAGTTRDVLREDIVLEGLPLTVVDTAGLRETQDPVEREGVRRAWSALERAEVVLFMIDDRAGLTRADEDLLERLPCGPEVLLIRNKCDLSGHPASCEREGQRTVLRIAAQNGTGVELLVDEIKRIAGLGSGTEGLFSARARHVEALQRTLAFVLDAQRRLIEGATPELAAEELRLAQQALSEITGEFTTEDLLGRIFADFCIGK
jgi:tRNA modification GTPase